MAMRHGNTHDDGDYDDDATDSDLPEGPRQEEVQETAQGIHLQGDREKR